MKLPLATLAFSLLAACASAGPSTKCPEAAAPTAAPSAHMRIKLTTIYVDDQEKALRFYTEVLGFTKKGDVTRGPFRWLTVISPDDPGGAELQLALDDNPAAKAFRDASFQQGQPAVMFFSDDVKAAVERIQAHGAEITLPPTAVPGATIAMLKDTCGNIVQISQLAHP